MSDTNHNRMIPLRVADMAVAACEAEIASLKAEVQRLKAELSNISGWGRGLECDLSRSIERLDTLCKQLMAQHSDISCENIMLRKAGDAMAEALNLDDDVFDNHEKKEAQANWNAAKEGKPSA
tara:strand:+ start:527 stop:895 length:369 start_codon:yes stop_codon:yes gene_type:complete